MADKPQADKATADTTPEIQTDVKSADLPRSTPAEMRDRAEDLPEKDDVQKAYKQAMTADTNQGEDRGFLKAAELSPDAMDTPSGIALKKAVGVSNDTERGEKYAREKTAARWGYVPVDD